MIACQKVPMRFSAAALGEGQYWYSSVRTSSLNSFVSIIIAHFSSVSLKVLDNDDTNLSSCNLRLGGGNSTLECQQRYNMSRSHKMERTKITE